LVLLEGSGLRPQRGGDPSSACAWGATAGRSLPLSLDGEAALGQPNWLWSLCRRLSQDGRLGTFRKPPRSLSPRLGASPAAGRVWAFSICRGAWRGLLTYMTYRENADGQNDHRGTDARSDPFEAW